MYARLQLLGTGVDGDDWRVDLPNYAMVSSDTTNMTAVVSFGTRDGPPNLPAQGTPLYPLEGGMYILIGLSPADQTAWYARLASRYPGHEPPFTPEFP